LLTSSTVIFSNWVSPKARKVFFGIFCKAWWYCTLVDAKIFEIKKASGNYTGKIIDYIEKRYAIELIKINRGAVIFIKINVWPLFKEREGICTA
jgi:hypothetical protein